MQVHILAQSVVSVSALEGVAKEMELKNSDYVELKSSIVQPEMLNNSFNVVVVFREIAAILENRTEQLPTTNAPQLAVIVDYIDLSSLDPLKEAGGWGCLVAMLILTFPDVRWVFGLIYAKTEKESEIKYLRYFHDLDSFYREPVSNLFDGSGLREYVRKQIKTKNDGHCKKMKERPLLAIALDDELQFTYFNSMAAYRFGWRCFPIDSQTVAKSLLGVDSKADIKIDLTFEDFHLNFPDRTKEFGSLSKLEDRAERLPKLNDASKRLFVTASDSDTNDDENKNYIEQLSKDNRTDPNGKISKPVKGFFGFGILSNWSQDMSKRNLTSYTHSKCDNLENKSGGHSAPGRLLEVSTTLLARASRIAKDGETLTSSLSAIQGAVMATDALELLGDKTPTTSIAALALKHELEVTAEVQFLGVTLFKNSTQERFREIRSSVDKLTGDIKKNPVANIAAQLSIINHLIPIYNAHHQIDAEAVLLEKERRLDVRRTYKPLKWRFNNEDKLLYKFLECWEWIWSIIFYMPRLYVCFLMGSIARLTVASAVWIFALSWLLGCVDRPTFDIDKLTENASPFGWGFQDSFFSFVSIGQINQFSNLDTHMNWFILIAFTMLLGVVHVGLLISHLYSIVSRR